MGEVMRFLEKCKDGGPESTVTAYVLIEIKCLFSIMLLRFDGDSREAFHSHAFNAVSWLLKGMLVEHFRNGTHRCYFASMWPIITGRRTYHKVDSEGLSWALTFRGPWRSEWHETLPGKGEITLTHGRELVS